MAPASSPRELMPTLLNTFAEVDVFCPRADEQLAGNLAIGATPARRAWRPAARAGERVGPVASARGLARGGRFLAGALGPVPRADIVEDGDRGPQVDAGVDAAAGCVGPRSAFPRRRHCRWRRRARCVSGHRSPAMKSKPVVTSDGNAAEGREDESAGRRPSS
jgi:hypothetical protein